MEPSRKKFRAVSRLIGYKGVAGVKTRLWVYKGTATCEKQQGIAGNYRELQGTTGNHRVHAMTGLRSDKTRIKKVPNVL